jgi:hypothetical protein
MQLSVVRVTQQELIASMQSGPRLACLGQHCDHCVDGL